MQKAKIGIPVGLMAAAAYFLGLYGGYVIAGLFVGYVLLKEEDLWLKKQSVRALALMIMFSLLSTAINLMPNLLNLMSSTLELVNVHYYFSFIHNFFNLISSVLSVMKTVAFVLLGIFAFARKPLKVPVLDTIIEKYMN